VEVVEVLMGATILEQTVVLVVVRFKVVLPELEHQVRALLAEQQVFQALMAPVAAEVQGLLELVEPAHTEEMVELD